MQRRWLGLGGSSALGVTLGIALVVSCSVYDESLLTGGSKGQGGSATGGEGGAGDGTGGTSSEGGTQGGGTTSTGGSSGDGGSSTGGSDNGGTAGDTGGSTTGGSSTGGDAGETATGGDAGSSTGGKAGSGNGGDGGSGGTAGSGSGGGGMGGKAGSGGTSGSGGAAGSGGAGGSGGMCGKCGCGMPETDTDGDLVPDCIDMCAGYPDANCTALKNGLVHRYSFGGTGTQVTDSKGTSHGTATNATLSGTGTLALAGGNSSTAPPYVNLPNGLISTLTNTTLELWVTWSQSGTTGRDWQRIFDFGTSGTEDTQASASSTTMSYLFLTPRASTTGFVRAVITASGQGGEIPLDGTAALPTGTRQHAAVVVSDSSNTIALYVNGAVVDSATFSGTLSQISDVNNWLGRSQYAADYEFPGIFDEFRIYNIALSATQMTTSFMAGPDAAFLQ
jgi:hypothetical protein